MNGATGEKIGIIGIGSMGIAIAKHLMRKGYRVVGYDISDKACEAARAIGAETAASPAAVGRETSTVIIVVGFDDETTAVLTGKDGLLETLKPGSAVAISSTCTPEHVKMLAGEAAAKQVDILDAPICRGQQAADAGTMLCLCGGSQAVFDRFAPVLGTFASDIRLLGDIGAGQFGKTLNNYLLWVNGVALIEAGRMAEANGIDLVKLREALLLSSGASDALKNWENVSFRWALKDMQIVLKIADAANLSLPVAGAIKELVKDGRRIKQSNPPDWTGRNRTKS